MNKGIAFLISCLLMAVIFSAIYSGNKDRIRKSLLWYETAKRVDDNIFQIEDAIDAYERAAELNPWNPELVLQASDFLLRYERKDAALACINRALSYAPDNADIWEEKAKIHQHKSEIGESIEAYRQVLRYDPARTIIYQKMIGMCESTNNLEIALELYREAQSAIPEERWVWNDCGSLLFWRLNRKQEGLALFEKALAVEQTSNQAHLDMAMALEELGRKDEAGRELDSAISLSEDKSVDQGWYTFLKAERLAKEGKILDAEAAYLKALESVPGNNLAWYDLGVIRRKLNRPLDLQFEAFVRAGESESAWFGRCVVHRDMNRLDESSAAYGRSFSVYLERLSDIDARQSLRDRLQFKIAMGLLDYMIEEFGETTSVLGMRYKLEMRAEVLALLGDFDRAEIMADSCIALGIESDRSWNIKGRALANHPRVKN